MPLLELGIPQSVCAASWSAKSCGAEDKRPSSYIQCQLRIVAEFHHCTDSEFSVAFDEFVEETFHRSSSPSGHILSKTGIRLQAAHVAQPVLHPEVQQSVRWSYLPHFNSWLQQRL